MAFQYTPYALLNNQREAGDNTTFYTDQWGRVHYYDPEINQYVANQNNDGSQQFAEGYSKDDITNLYAKYGLPAELANFSGVSAQTKEMNGGLYVPLSASGVDDYYSSANFYNDPTADIKAMREAMASRVITQDGEQWTPIQDYVQSQETMRPYARPDQNDFISKTLIPLVSKGLMFSGLAPIAGGFGTTSLFESAGMSNPFSSFGNLFGGSPESSVASTGGNNMSFLDDLFGLDDIDLGNAVNPFTTNPSLGSLGGNVGSFDAWDWLGTDETLGGLSADELAGGGSLSGMLNNLPPGTSTLLKALLGGGGGGGDGGLLEQILGGGRGLLGTLASTAPALAAVSYAKNQDPFDTSRLESLYSSFDPSAQTSQYDTNTGLGRTALTSNLARRGVSGSSFGDQSLTNFNTSRDLGRNSLINQGIGVQGDLAGKILASDVESRKQKNDLYGRALLALSGGLSPRLTGGLLA